MKHKATLPIILKCLVLLLMLACKHKREEGVAKMAQGGGKDKAASRALLETRNSELKTQN